MSFNVQLPECVHTGRFGHWSMGSESEYDANGELAPITWFCDCGARLTLEVLNHRTDQYMPVSEEDKHQFLSLHVNCTATCYKCSTTTVETYGLWCEACEDKES